MRNFIRKYIKYAIAIIILVTLFSVYYFYCTGDVSDVELVIDNEADFPIHSDEEIEEAFEVVKRNFKYSFYRCKLLKLKYSDNSFNENPYEMEIECYYISLSKDDGPGNRMGNGVINSPNFYLKLVNGKWKFDGVGFR